jgi:hypothetical protein
MPTLTIEKLGETVGAQVVGVDRDRLLADDGFPEWCLEALDASPREMHRTTIAGDEAMR